MTNEERATGLAIAISKFETIKPQIKLILAHDEEVRLEYASRAYSCLDGQGIKKDRYGLRAFIKTAITGNWSEKMTQKELAKNILAIDTIEEIIQLLKTAPSLFCKSDFEIGFMKSKEMQWVERRDAILIALEKNYITNEDFIKRKTMEKVQQDINALLH